MVGMELGVEEDKMGLAVVGVGSVGIGEVTGAVEVTGEAGVGEDVVVPCQRWRVHLH